MSTRIDLDRYVRVSDRVRAFYRTHPGGAIQTELVHLDDDRVVFKACAYRAPDDRHPTTWWAWDRPTGERSAVVGHCERAAVGRALANLDLAGGRRPSREEMAKVVRMQNEPRRGGDSISPARRVRHLLEERRLPAAKRRRIERRLESAPNPQELYELEAYLLALRPKRR